MQFSRTVYKCEKHQIIGLQLHFQWRTTMAILLKSHSTLCNNFPKIGRTGVTFAPTTSEKQPLFVGIAVYIAEFWRLMVFRCDSWSEPIYGISLHFSLLCGANVWPRSLHLLSGETGQQRAIHVHSIVLVGTIYNFRGSASASVNG